MKAEQRVRRFSQRHPKLLLRLIKSIYLYFADEVYFWSHIHWRHRNEPGSHTAVYPPPSDPVSSPSGILPFSWWKTFLGSCTNELALLLNDVCKLWPSLLPVNAADIQNPHCQLGARRRCQRLVVEFGKIICSSLAQPSGLGANGFLLYHWAYFVVETYLHITHYRIWILITNNPWYSNCIGLCLKNNYYSLHFYCKIPTF